MKKKNKKSIVLIHGLRGNHKGLERIAKELEEDFDVYLPDIPGSGENAELERQNLESYIEWLHKYITSLPQKPVLVAHSMGSIVASHYLQKYPQDVEDKAILMSPIFRKSGGKAFGKLSYGAIRLVLFPFSAKSQHRILASRKVSWVISHFLTYDKTKQKWIDEQHYEYSGKFASAKSLLGDIKMSSTHETQMPEEKEILIIFGKGDRLTNYKVTRERVKNKKVQSHEIAQAGHLLNYETPEEVAATINDFLNKD